jgi:AcrR family transcriptional regulator
MAAPARPQPPAAAEPVRKRLLDAVGALLSERRWERVTMAEIAARAGVSRQTLYNEFGGRDEIAQAYVIREAEGFLSMVEQAIEANGDDPRAALEAAVSGFLSIAAGHPLVGAIVGEPGGEELLALVTTRGGPVLDGVTARLAAMLTATWPVIDPGEAEELSENLVRLAISHAALPSAPPTRTGETVAGLLGPWIDTILARAETPAG